MGQQFGENFGDRHLGHRVQVEVAPILIGVGRDPPRLVQALGVNAGVVGGMQMGELVDGRSCQAPQPARLARQQQVPGLEIGGGLMG